MYRYEDHKYGGGIRSHKVRKLGCGTRAHEVHKGCWQVGSMTGTGVLLRYSVPSLGVMWSMCCGQCAMVDLQWPSVVFDLSELQTI